MTNKYNWIHRAAQAYAYLGQPGAPRPVLSVSGGKDSGALYLFLCYLADKYGFEFDAVFADTGNEHPLTLEYICNLPRLAGGGPAIKTVRADFSARVMKRREYVAAHYEPELAEAILPHLHPTGIPFLDLCLWKGRFPSVTRKFCTAELKIIPLREYLDALIDQGFCVESWQGIRAEESLKRARMSKRQIEDVNLWIVRPALRWKIQRGENKKPAFARWRLDHIKGIHEYFNVPLNPLYRMGCGRVGCMPCINSAKAELYQISQRWPDVIARISSWEKAVSLVSKIGGSTFFHKKGMSEAVKADRRLVAAESGIHGIMRWGNTTYGGKQYCMLKACFPVPACQSEYGLCE